MTRLRLTTALLVGLALSATALAEDEEAPLRPHDFATGRAIETSSDAPLQTLLVDLPIYRGSVALRLADVRVMNAAGEPVPHAVRHLTGSSEETRADASLPIFALRESEQGSPKASESLAVGGGGTRAYRIRAEVSESGALVEVESTPPDAVQVGSDAGLPPAYLLDASQLGAAIVRLDFDLAPGGPDASGFVVPVSVEGSNDLIRFQPLGQRAALVRLEQDGHQIGQSHVALPSVRHRYLRVSWPDAPLPVEVRGVRARLKPKVSSPSRDRTRVAGTPVEGESGAFLFDLGGEIPVDRAQVLLPQTNTLLQARLLSSPTSQGPWKLQYDGLLYDLEYGQTLRNPELRLKGGRHRYLKLVAARGGGGLTNGAPQLEVRWHSEQLLFVGRGEPPFQLVYGRSGATPTPFTTAQLLKAWPGATRDLPRASARLGDVFALGDPGVLEPPAAPPPYRTWALWSVLVLAVGAVLAMSASLLRQIRSRDA